MSDQSHRLDRRSDNGSDWNEAGTYTGLSWISGETKTFAVDPTAVVIPPAYRNLSAPYAIGEFWDNQVDAPFSLRVATGLTVPHAVRAASEHTADFGIRTASILQAQFAMGAPVSSQGTAPFALRLAADLLAIHSEKVASTRLPTLGGTFLQGWGSCRWLEGRGSGRSLTR